MVDLKDFCTAMKDKYQDKDKQLVKAECVHPPWLLLADDKFGVTSVPISSVPSSSVPISSIPISSVPHLEFTIEISRGSHKTHIKPFLEDGKNEVPACYN